MFQKSLKMFGRKLHRSQAIEIQYRLAPAGYREGVRAKLKLKHGPRKSRYAIAGVRPDDGLSKSWAPPSMDWTEL